MAKKSNKKSKKNTVQVDFKGIESRAKRRMRIAEGNYKAVVAEVENLKSKAGDPMVKWAFDIVEHEKYEGQRFWYNNVLTPKALWNFRSVLESLGVKVKDSTMNIPLNRLVGRTCGIEVVDGEYEGKTRSEINDIFPEALLEEDEEDDDEDDFDEEDDDFEEEDDADEEEEDEEDDWDEEDEEEEDEDEEVLSREEVEEMGIKDLRAYAREQDVYEKGMKKADIMEAFFGEDDEEEIDLDEDEL